MDTEEKLEYTPDILRLQSEEVQQLAKFRQQVDICLVKKGQTIQG